MNWLWPRHLHTETTALIRLGRVLHWLSLIIAAIIVFAAFGNSDWASFLVAAGVCTLVGRAVRYILADE